MGIYVQIRQTSLGTNRAQNDVTIRVHIQSGGTHSLVQSQVHEQKHNQSEFYSTGGGVWPK